VCLVVDVIGRKVAQPLRSQHDYVCRARGEANELWVGRDDKLQVPTDRFSDRLRAVVEDRDFCRGEGHGKSHWHAQRQLAGEDRYPLSHEGWPRPCWFDGTDGFGRGRGRFLSRFR
jgi:hypothetical protein